MLVSYNLGARNAFTGQMAAPTTQMMVGPDGIARPYLVQAGQAAFGQALPGQPYGWSPVQHDDSGSCRSDGYAALSGISAGAVSGADAIRHRAGGCAARRCVACRRSGSCLKVKPRRSWQKSALLIGGSAGAGAGVGALVGGKKGALAGAAIGGGAAAIYDQVKRH